MYACLAVTWHLHFWQNDRDFLRATVVTRGWNGYRNKSQHRKSTLEKKILPPFQQGFEPATFQSRVRCSNHWAIPAPCRHHWLPKAFICDAHPSTLQKTTYRSLPGAEAGVVIAGCVRWLAADLLTCPNDGAGPRRVGREGVGPQGAMGRGQHILQFLLLLPLHAGKHARLKRLRHLRHLILGVVVRLLRKVKLSFGWLFVLAEWYIKKFFLYIFHPKA